MCLRDRFKRRALDHIPKHDSAAVIPADKIVVSLGDINRCDGIVTMPVRGVAENLSHLDVLPIAS